MGVSVAFSVYEVTNSDAEEILQKSTEPRSEDDAVLLRGLPFSCNEDDVARFFSGEEFIQRP